MPTQWHKGILIPLYKQGDLKEVKNYGPITRLVHARNIIESGIRIQIMRAHKFKEIRLGFLKKTRTETAIVRHLRCAAEFPWYTVLDLQKAYDAASRKFIMNLVKRILCTEVVTMISLVLQPLEILTKDNGTRTTATVTKGVPRGSSFSPIMFNFLIDSLHDKLQNHIHADAHRNSERQTWQLAMFEDDLKIQAETQITLQTVLTRTSEWATHLGMQWGTSKCFVLAPSTATEPIHISL